MATCPPFHKWLWELRAPALVLDAACGTARKCECVLCPWWRLAGWRISAYITTLFVSLFLEHPRTSIFMLNVRIFSRAYNYVAKDAIGCLWVGMWHQLVRMQFSEKEFVDTFWLGGLSTRDLFARVERQQGHHLCLLAVWPRDTPGLRCFDELHAMPCRLLAGYHRLSYFFSSTVLLFSSWLSLIELCKKGVYSNLFVSTVFF